MFIKETILCYHLHNVSLIVKYRCGTSQLPHLGSCFNSVRPIFPGFSHAGSGTPAGGGSFRVLSSHIISLPTAIHLNRQT